MTSSAVTKHYRRNNLVLFFTTRCACRCERPGGPSPQPARVSSLQLIAQCAKAVEHFRVFMHNFLIEMNSSLFIELLGSGVLESEESLSIHMDKSLRLCKMLSLQNCKNSVHKIDPF